MADVRCPNCKNMNPEGLAICQHCGGELSSDAIHPGDTPIKKNTSELEHALPDWLRKARQAEQPSGPQQAGQFDTPAEPPKKEELPNWLDGLQAEAESEDDEVPEWLRSIAVDTPAKGERPPGEPPESLIDASGRRADTTPRQRTPEQAAPPPAEEPSGPESKPPEAGAPRRTTPAAHEELPGWLSDQVSAADEKDNHVPLLGGEDQPEAGRGDDLPDWLANIAAGTEVESEPLPVGKLGDDAPAGEQDEDLPGWLRGMRGEPAQGSIDLPGEMPTAGDEQTPEPVADTEESTPGEPGELPDWLGNLRDEQAPVPGAQEPQESPLAGDLPDWLGGEQPARPAPAFESESQESAPAEPGELPDWLASLQAEQAPDEAAAPAPSGPALIMEEGGAPPSGPVEDPFAVDMPDWLSGAESARQAAAQPSEEEEITPGELPSWVQAMRPVEAVLAPEPAAQGGEGEGVSEASGPLAGLRGVLPVIPGIGPTRRPQPLTVKLAVTDSQQSHAALLEHMLEFESKPRPLGASGRTISSRVLRWVIAAVMLLVTALPLWGGLQMTPMGTLFPPETAASVDAVNALPAGAPVLLVFDYDPALAGELEAAASPLMDHLMLRGARLTVVSTSLTGPVLAERFIGSNPGGHVYQRGQEYANLGYLPGGASGILAFALDPSGILPLDVDGLPAWGTPPLQGVQRLSDYSALVVLTDNADAARLWVEQTTDYRGQAVLLMVVSAQAEPLARPYYDSGQVQGLVTGLSGGAAYEQFTGRPGAVRSYWDAYGLGLTMAVVLIVIGVVWGMISGARRRPEGEEV